MVVAFEQLCFMQNKSWKEAITQDWAVFAKDVNIIFGKYWRVAKSKLGPVRQWIEA